MQKRHPGEGGAVLLLAGDEQSLSTKLTPDFQLLRERRLIARHRVRPAIAGLVACLAYGGAHG